MKYDVDMQILSLKIYFNVQKEIKLKEKQMNPVVGFIIRY